MEKKITFRLILSFLIVLLIFLLCCFLYKRININHSEADKKINDINNKFSEIIKNEKEKKELFAESGSNILLENNIKNDTQNNSKGEYLLSVKQSSNYKSSLLENILIKKDQLLSSGELLFNWKDKEISNSLKINKNGKVSWESLRDYPEGCPDGYAISSIGDSIECAKITKDNNATEINNDIEWENIKTYPNPCGANQAIQSIGKSLTCIDIPSEGNSLFTDSGATTYLTSQNDNFSIGGNDTSAPFYFDVSSGEFNLDSINIGNNTDNITILNDGTMRFNGNSTVWDDIKVPVTSATRSGGKDPDFLVFTNDGVSSQGVFTYNFDKFQEEELYFTVQLPHKYKEGSDIYPHLHWTPTDTDTGDIVWGLEYVWKNINETFDTTSIKTLTDTAEGIANKQQIVGFGALDGTGKRMSSMLVCRIFRKAGDSNDTYDNDAALLEVDFHYEIDKVGSDNQF